MTGDPYAGPFEVGGGDGNDYFTILPPEPLLIDAFLLLEEARKEALRHPIAAEGKARAAAISLVISQVGADVEAASILAAQEAEALIVGRINATQKRPDPIGGKVRRLRDAIVCRALPTVIPGGGIGIGDLTNLNEVADAQGRAYWRAQEFGSTHLVGKTLYGFFQPGESPAGAAPSRTHPIFEVTQGGPPMTIENPIPEKAFLREGATLAEVFRQRQLGNAVSGGITELAAITAGASATLDAVRRVVR